MQNILCRYNCQILCITYKNILIYKTGPFKFIDYFYSYKITLFSLNEHTDKNYTFNYQLSGTCAMVEKFQICFNTLFIPLIFNISLSRGYVFKIIT